MKHDLGLKQDSKYLNTDLKVWPDQQPDDSFLLHDEDLQLPLREWDMQTWALHASNLVIHIMLPFVLNNNSSAFV